ncbi:hypothetical protein OAA60_05340 [Porticoccaceae bacterium]|jgi:hypothetical protein|nr:hypothetical protein [Porticoccaceae bacterium]
MGKKVEKRANLPFLSHEKVITIIALKCKNLLKNLLAYLKVGQKTCQNGENCSFHVYWTFLKWYIKNPQKSPRQKIKKKPFFETLYVMTIFKKTLFCEHRGQMVYNGI